MRIEGRYPALDGLRAIAAYTVVVSHFTNLTGIFGGVFGFGAGQMGVMLFFVISGFLMGKLYAELPWSAAAVLDFYRKRAARVLPLFLLVVIASFAAVTMRGDAGILYEVGPRNIWRHLLFVRGTSVLWTIPVEVQFYAIFPAIWLLYRWIGRTLLVWLALAAVAAYSADWRYPVLISHLPFFLAGIALALAPTNSTYRGADIAFAAALVGYVLTMPRMIGADPSAVWGLPLYLLTSTAMVWTALVSPIANRVLGDGILKALGDSSYSAYLLHLPVLHLLMITPLAQANIYIALGVFLIATALVSWVSFVYLETPSRRLISNPLLLKYRQ